MKLIIDIPKDSYERVMNPNKFYRDIDGEKIRWAVYKGTPIPDNATFGDVIEKITNRKPLEDNKDADNIIISTKLWNSPYQKGGKE